jgi:outer membrane protein TolC
MRHLSLLRIVLSGNIMKYSIFGIKNFMVCASLLTEVALAQTYPPFKVADTNYQAITLGAYLNELQEKNSTIKIKKIAVDSATATAKQAGNPYLSPILTYARGSIYTQAPYTGYTSPASNTLGATVTVEGWGKRSAREAYAQAEANRQLAEMVNETRSVETQAIFNYIDALRTKLLWQSYQLAIDKLNALSGQNSTTQKVEFLAAQKVLANDLKYYSYALMGFLNTTDQALPLPMGSLQIPPQNLSVNELIEQAQSNRTDLHSGKASIESASANLEAEMLIFYRAFITLKLLAMPPAGLVMGLKNPLVFYYPFLLEIAF